MAADQPTQRELAAAEARERILAAATRCIVRDGLAQVRTAGIAREAGVSSGLLHYHFATKERLFAAVLTWSHDTAVTINAEAMRKAGSEPSQRLSAFLDRCLPSDEQCTHEWLLWQELALLCIRQPELAIVGAELYEDLYATVAGIIADGVDAGVFRPLFDGRRVAETAVALCDGLGGRVLSGDPGMTLVDARQVLLETVGTLVGFDGTLPDPADLLGGRS